jgi:UDP-glucose 4-epimerase
VATVRVIVTGAAGFIGSHLVKRLRRDGHHVLGLDLYVYGRHGYHHGVEFGDAADIIHADPDVVVHLAAIARSGWPSPADLYQHNVVTTLRLLERLGSADLIHASSCVVADPVGVYAETKAIAERAVLDAGHLALRFANVYGPGQSQHGPAPNICAALLRAREAYGRVEVHGDGSQTRDFVHVDDVVDAIAALIGRRMAGCVDIATGVQTPIIDVARRLGCPIDHGPSRGDPQSFPQDGAPLRQLLGRDPISVADGMTFLEV